jgi:hypothetical protein
MAFSRTQETLEQVRPEQSVERQRRRWSVPRGHFGEDFSPDSIWDSQEQLDAFGERLMPSSPRSASIPASQS